MYCKPSSVLGSMSDLHRIMDLSSGGRVVSVTPALLRGNLPGPDMSMRASFVHGLERCKVVVVALFVSS